MKFQHLLFTAAISLLSSPAFAEGLEEVGETRTDGNRLGVGVEATLASPLPLATAGAGGPAGALALSYDTTKFRIDGLLFLLHLDDSFTSFALGGRFFFVVDQGRVADFSVGGGLALGVLSPDMGDATVGVSIEGAMQLRVFLSSNVALSATAGLGVAFGHGGSFLFGIGGQLTGGMGVIYYF